MLLKRQGRGAVSESVRLPCGKRLAALHVTHGEKQEKNHLLSWLRSRGDWSSEGDNPDQLGAEADQGMARNSLPWGER